MEREPDYKQMMPAMLLISKTNTLFGLALAIGLLLEAFLPAI